MTIALGCHCFNGTAGGNGVGAIAKNHFLVREIGALFQNEFQDALQRDLGIDNAQAVQGDHRDERRLAWRT